MINNEPPPQVAHWLLMWKLNGGWTESKMWGGFKTCCRGRQSVQEHPGSEEQKGRATQLKQHYVGKLLTSHTQLQLSLIWEWILSKAIIVRDGSASFASLLIWFTGRKCPQWLSRTVDCDVLRPVASHFSVTLPIDQHYLSTFSSQWWVNTWAFGLRPTSTSNLTLGKQVLMVPGERIMRHPDALRSGSGRDAQSSHCHAVMRHGHWRGVKRCPGLTPQSLEN